MQSVRVSSQNTYTNTCMTSRSLPQRSHKLAKLLQVFPSQNVVPSLAAMMSLLYNALSSPQFSLTQKDLFSSHKLASTHLIEALLNIFIDIEFTGESMEFEDKFRECVWRVRGVLWVVWGVWCLCACEECVRCVWYLWCVCVCVCVCEEWGVRGACVVWGVCSICDVCVWGVYGICNVCVCVWGVRSEEWGVHV